MPLGPPGGPTLRLDHPQRSKQCDTRIVCQQQLERRWDGQGLGVYADQERIQYAAQGPDARARARTGPAVALRLQSVRSAREGATHRKPTHRDVVPSICAPPQARSSGGKSLIECGENQLCVAFDVFEKVRD